MLEPLPVLEPGAAVQGGRVPRVERRGVGQEVRLGRPGGRDMEHAAAGARIQLAAGEPRQNGGALANQRTRVLRLAGNVRVN